MDYMSQPAEIASHPHAQRSFETMANGNADALKFLWAFWNWGHAFDDMLDGDVKSKELTMKAWADFVLQLSFNEFFIANRQSLIGFILHATTRWMDGDEWEKSESEKRRIQSEVIRCGDIDLYIHVALLCGGWDHMRKCSREFRSYDDNNLTEKQ